MHIKEMVEREGYWIQPTCLEYNSFKKLNNTLGVMCWKAETFKSRDFVQMCLQQCVTWRTYLRWRLNVTWSQGILPVWVKESRGRKEWEREWEKYRERWMGCCCLSTVSIGLEAGSGRGTAAGSWYVCEGSGRSTGAGITLQAGKGLWRWQRGWRWRVWAPVW